MTPFKKDQRGQRHKFWAYHLQQWENSGLSQAEYCRRNNVKIKSFTYWKAKLKNVNPHLELVRLPQPVNDFTPVARIHLDKGIRLEVPDGFSSVTLANILRAIQVFR